MILLIIRHGESEADLLDVHEGRADFELTELGHRQAAAMAEYVSSRIKLDRIYASTLRRASQTAAHLAEATGAAVTYMEDLMEFNNGLLAGLSRDEAARLYPEVKNLPIDQSVYGQESRVQFRARADKALKQVLSENDRDSVIALVTHGGMANQLFGSLLGLPVDTKAFFCTDVTAIHVWEITDSRNIIVQVNLAEHLKAQGLRRHA